MLEILVIIGFILLIAGSVANVVGYPLPGWLCIIIGFVLHFVAYLVGGPV